MAEKVAAATSGGRNCPDYKGGIGELPKAHDLPARDGVDVGECRGEIFSRGLVLALVDTDRDDRVAGIVPFGDTGAPVVPIAAELGEDVIEDVDGAFVRATPGEAIVLDPLDLGMHDRKNAIAVARGEGGVEGLDEEEIDGCVGHGRIG